MGVRRRDGFPLRISAVDLLLPRSAERELFPTVRVSERQMHPDPYSSWKNLQWSPPEFVRAPGGPPSNVAISHVRLGGRAAFTGKAGDDDFGNDLLYRMNVEKVQIRGGKIDPTVKTAASYMRIGFRDDGDEKRLVAETVKACTEDSFSRSEVDVAVLKELKPRLGSFTSIQKFSCVPQCIPPSLEPLPYQRNTAAMCSLI